MFRLTIEIRAIDRGGLSKLFSEALEAYPSCS